MRIKTSFNTYGSLIFSKVRKIKTFWTFQEFASTSNTDTGDNWSVQITELSVNPTPQNIIEAEDLNLVNYRVEDNDFASNGELISLSGAESHTGTASTTFIRDAGLYDIVTGYFDENDGNARFSFEVYGVLVDNWIADQDLGSGSPNEETFTRRTIGGVELETGDELTIVGTRNGSDFARVDFVELLPRDIFSTISDSTVAALPEEMSEFG